MPNRDVRSLVPRSARLTAIAAGHLPLSRSRHSRDAIRAYRVLLDELGNKVSRPAYRYRHGTTADTCDIALAIAALRSLIDEPDVTRAAPLTEGRAYSPIAPAIRAAPRWRR